MMVITSLSFPYIDQDVPLHTIRDAIRCIVLWLSKLTIVYIKVCMTYRCLKYNIHV
jgi:hypothetical protein